MTNLDYSDYVGRIAVGKIVNGRLQAGAQTVLLKKGEVAGRFPLTHLYTYKGLERLAAKEIMAGDIAAVAGVEEAFIGDTLADPEDPRALPAISVEEPTISMDFSVNTSPMAGREGSQVTSRQIKARLEKETLYNVSIRVEDGPTSDTFKVYARGELQLAVLVETMRREGFELSLSKPQHHHQEGGRGDQRAPGLAGGGRAEEYVGVVTEKLASAGARCARCSTTARAGCAWSSRSHRGAHRLPLPVPPDTRGTGISHLVIGYAPLRRGHRRAHPTARWSATAWARRWPTPSSICSPGAPSSWSPASLLPRPHRGAETRGRWDIAVNITKERSSPTCGPRAAMRPCAWCRRGASPGAAMEYINEDELVDGDPKSIRLRKKGELKLGGARKNL